MADTPDPRFEKNSPARVRRDAAPPLAPAAESVFKMAPLTIGLIALSLALVFVVVVLARTVSARDQTIVEQQNRPQQSEATRQLVRSQAADDKAGSAKLQVEVNDAKAGF